MKSPLTTYNKRVQDESEALVFKNNMNNQNKNLKRKK